MHTIQEQLELENEMLASGAANFFRKDKEAMDKGRTLEVSFARRLLPSTLQAAVEAFKKFKASDKAHAGINYQYIPMLEKLSAEQIAFFSIREVLGALITMKPLQAVAGRIGTAIEDEQKVSMFKEQHEEDYNMIMRELHRSRSRNFSHTHNVFSHMAKTNKTPWVSWAAKEKHGLGLLCIRIVLECTDIVKITKNNRMLYLKPTEACLDWVSKYKDYASVLSPSYGPCVIPPADWESRTVGGYHNPTLRARVPMVKCRTKQQRDALDAVDIPEVRSAMNAIQRTAWQINPDTFPILKEVWAKNLHIGLPASQPLPIPVAPVPPELKKEDMNPEQLKAFTAWKQSASVVYTMERIRISKCFQLVSLIHMANKYEKLGVLYYPVQTDFRSRVYTTCPAWSPQGADYSKGILRFKEGKAITAQGEKWFLMHGANKFGYDKLTFDDRVSSILKLHDQILATAEDPISMRDFWGDCDHPWQFLAWCYEYARYAKDGVNTISHLPMALDGSCNGLQHYSAMLRDEVGSRATNVLHSDEPHDIYQEVADVVIARLEASSEPLARRWLEFGVTRALMKRPVMTMPYGATRDTCLRQITDYVMEKNRDYFKTATTGVMDACSYLATVIWECIGEVVIAARAGMDWLKDTARTMVKQGATTIRWTTPVGFPVVQDERVLDTIRVRSVVDRPRRVVVGIITDKTNAAKMKSGIAPNFVHSMDASHMMRTVNAASAEGMKSFACIHDDYGVHAADTGRFFEIIREQFVDMYTKHSPLEEFKRTQEEAGYSDISDLPPIGTLDITDVLKSKYFFS